MPIAHAEVKIKPSSIKTLPIMTIPNKPLLTKNITPLVPKTAASNKSVSKSSELKLKETQNKTSTSQNQAKQVQMKPKEIQSKLATSPNQAKQLDKPRSTQNKQPAVLNKTKSKEHQNKPPSAPNKTKPATSQAKVEQKKTTISSTKSSINKKKVEAVKKVSTAKKETKVIIPSAKDIADARAHDNNFDALYGTFIKDVSEHNCLIRLSPSDMQALEPFKVGEAEDCDIRRLPLTKKQFEMIEPFITERDPKKLQKTLPPRPITPLRTKTPPPDIPVTKNVYKVIPNDDPIHIEDNLANYGKDIQYELDNGGYVEIFDPK